MSKFKFKILTGDNAIEKYKSMESHDALTFYLLDNGIGYLGDTLLFDGEKNIIFKQKCEWKTDYFHGFDNVELPQDDKIYVLHDVKLFGTVHKIEKQIIYDGNKNVSGIYIVDNNELIEYSYVLFRQYVVDNLITSIDSNDGFKESFKFPSTKAVVDYIDKKLNDSSIINAAFFRKVESHVLTADDITNELVSKPDGVTEGDVGLLFTADTDGEDGGENYYYVSLKKYITIYNTEDTDSIHMNVNENNTFMANLNVADSEKSIIIDSNGVSLNKSTNINDESPNQDKLVTEASLINYFKNTILPIVSKLIEDANINDVTYSVDDEDSENVND